ncbi:MAG: hypothetical protein GOU97_04385 [Nanoarchaeota archaeon]|nr:hypothetical protein [Nanoarchaeota archaeon]
MGFVKKREIIRKVYENLIEQNQKVGEITFSPKISFTINKFAYGGEFGGDVYEIERDYKNVQLIDFDGATIPIGLGELSGAWFLCPGFGPNIIALNKLESPITKNLEDSLRCEIKGNHLKHVVVSEMPTSHRGESYIGVPKVSRFSGIFDIGYRELDNYYHEGKYSTSLIETLTEAVEEVVVQDHHVVRLK